jgi:hypothetical protein
MRITVISVLTLATSIALCGVPGDAQAQLGANSSDLKQDELVGRINKLPPWRTTAYPATGWEEMISIAREFQKLSPEQAVAIIKRATRHGYCLDFNERLLVLFRVVFDLPEDAPSEENILYLGWGSSHQAFHGHRGERVNVAWPIRWTERGPEFVSWNFGYEGGPWDPITEYRYLLKRYPYRDLAARRKVGGTGS